MGFRQTSWILGGNFGVFFGLFLVYKKNIGWEVNLLGEEEARDGRLVLGAR